MSSRCGRGLMTAIGARVCRTFAVVDARGKITLFLGAKTSGQPNLLLP
jgi:hypothetical protein